MSYIHGTPDTFLHNGRIFSLICIDKSRRKVTLLPVFTDPHPRHRSVISLPYSDTDLFSAISQGGTIGPVSFDTKKGHSLRHDETTEGCFPLFVSLI